MTLADVARYLQLGQKTCLSLATTGKLPGILLENQWRFRRPAIDEWLSQQEGSGEGFEEMADGMKVPLGDLLPDNSIIDDMSAHDAISAIEELAARAYTAKWLNDKPWFVGALVEREALASTAMEGGVAFLHTRAREAGKIAQPFIVFGRSYQGIDFGAPDGKPTFVFFLLGLKYDRLHLPILGRLARVLRNPATIGKLRAAPSADKIRALLLRMDASAMDKSRVKSVSYAEPEPTMDRKSRLRAIMHLNARRKHEEKKAADAEKKAVAKAERKRSSATKTKASSKTATKKNTPAKKPSAKKKTAKKTDDD